MIAKTNVRRGSAGFGCLAFIGAKAFGASWLRGLTMSCRYAEIAGEAGLFVICVWPVCRLIGPGGQTTRALRRLVAWPPQQPLRAGENRAVLTTIINTCADPTAPGISRAPPMAAGHAARHITAAFSRHPAERKAPSQF